MANTFKPTKPAAINKSAPTKMAAIKTNKPKKSNPFSRSMVQAGPNTKYKNV